MNLQSILKRNYKNIKRPTFFGVVTALLVHLGILFLSYQWYSRLDLQKELTIKDAISTLETNIEKIITECVESLISLNIALDENGEVKDFDRTAKSITENNEYFRAVALLKDGTFGHIYPLNDSSKSLLGYNPIVDGSAFLKARINDAISEKRTIIAGPLKDRFGDSAVLAINPVFEYGKFWGISLAFLDLNRILLNAGIADSSLNRFNISISNLNPQTGQDYIFYRNSTQFDNKREITESIFINRWKLHAAAPAGDLIKVMILPYILSLLIAFLSGSYVNELVRKPRMLEETVREQEEKIYRSNLRFKSIFDNAPIGIGQIDHYTGRLTEANKKYCELAGYTKQELLELGLEKIIPPEIYYNAFDEFQEVIAGKADQLEREYKHEKEDGTHAWTHVTLKPIIDENGRIDSHLMVAEDITEMKNAREALLKSEIRFRSLFEESPVALWEEDFFEVRKYLAGKNLINRPREEINEYFLNNKADLGECLPNVKVLAFNKSALDLYGMKSAEELAQGFPKILMAPETWDLIILQLTAVSNGQLKFEGESTSIDTFGNPMTVRINWNVVPGHEESLRQVILAVTDLTKLKESEREIEASKSRFETMINTIEGTVWTADPVTLEYTYISDNAMNLLGYPKDIWVSKMDFCANYIHPDDVETIMSECKKNVDAGIPHTVEYRLQTKSGDIKWVRESINFIKNNGNIESLIGIISDVTNYRNAKDGLERSLNIVSQQNKQLMNFSYIVSHNLRSHISNILSLSDLVLDENTDAKDSKEYVTHLSNIAQILNNTMHGLNEVTQIHSGVNLKVKQLNLKDYINDTLNVLSNLIQSKKATIIDEVAADTTITFNRAYLESILLCFVSNAVKYSSPKRPSVIRLSFKKENGSEVLRIADNGIGIDLDKYGDRLFGLFKTFTTDPTARGIGLYIAKNQLEAMGGSVTVESKPDVGTTFSIHFN